MMTKPTVIVTGASRGIGASIAKVLAKEGFHVGINFSSSEEKALAVAKEIESDGGSAEILGFNVSDSKACDEKISEFAKKHGRLDALVNNAGITIDGLLIRMKDEDLDKTLSVDLKGAIYCTRSASKIMMKARSGSIVQISSVVGEMGNPGQAAYSAAKAGLIGFTKSVAKELASRSIRTNVVTPGYISTEMTGSLNENQKQAIQSLIPMESLGNPEDVAHLVGFLCSDKSRYITGQVIGVNGGLYV